MGQISRRRRPTVLRWLATRLGIAGLMVAAALVLMSAPAMADCPATDPTCLPGTTPDPVTTIGDATTEVTAVATDAVDQTTAAAQDAAAAATDQVNQAVKPVTDTVKGIVGQTPDPPDPGAINDPTGILDGVLGSTVDQPSGSGTTGSSGNGSATGSGGQSPAGSGTGPFGLGRRPVIGPVAGTISSTPAVTIGIPRRGLFDRIGSIAIQAGKVLAFPLALAVIVLLFVAVQNRIDRTDPKLALSPVAPDLLRFE